MARKGSNIYKRKDGRYEGRVPIGYKEDGKLKYKSVYDRTLSEYTVNMTDLYFSFPVFFITNWYTNRRSAILPFVNISSFSSHKAKPPDNF